MLLNRSATVVLLKPVADYSPAMKVHADDEQQSHAGMCSVIRLLNAICADSAWM